MENAISLVEDLYRYNDWAHGRLFRLCDGLDDTQLDEPREMGFGSLRNTLFHIMIAEQIWMERWKLIPWRPFPVDAGGMPLAEIESRLDELSRDRQRLMDSERNDNWNRSVTYRDSKGNEYTNDLSSLLLHVANHSTHHRAQALNFLKSYGRTIPVGLDYLMYKLARPTLVQMPETTQTLGQAGLELASAAGNNVHWDATFMQRYFEYHDWATDKVIDSLQSAEAAAWDIEFPMGLGTIRKTLTHLLDAESWWWGIWQGTGSGWPDSSGLGASELRDHWIDLRLKRRQFISNLNSDSAQRVTEAIAGGPIVKIRVIESLVQLCTHGTHHRAQLVNMLRRSQLKPPAIDVIVWLRDRTPTS